MKVAALQSGLDGIAGVDLASILSECGRQHVELLVLPECFFGGMPSSPSAAAQLALQAPYPQVADAFRDCPAQLNVVVGLTERGADGKVYSSAIVWQRGKAAAKPTRKLFPREAGFAPGSELPVYETGAARFGIVICRDCNYIEPARLLKLKGAQILACPLNNDLPENVTSRWATRTRANLIARAVENDCFVIAADVSGTDNNGNLGGGATQIIATDGEVLAAADRDAHGLVIADLQLERSGLHTWDVRHNPAVFTAWRHAYDVPPS